MSIKIGDLTLEVPAAMGPMAGVTDQAYRILCHEQGCGLMYTEMVSAKAILYKNKNSKALMEITPAEGPVGLQLFGSDPQLMGEIAMQVQDLYPYPLIDVNMGCPVPKVVNNGEGSALMKDPQLAASIIREMVKRVHKPVTVKFRKGFYGDEVLAPDFARAMEDAGAAALAIHGRTREQYYSGAADWDVIRQVKEAVSIPVFGNGDIFTPGDALSMMEQTGCDGVMVARGARGNPWIFDGIRKLLAAGSGNVSYHEQGASEECGKNGLQVSTYGFAQDTAMEAAQEQASCPSGEKQKAPEAGIIHNCNNNSVQHTGHAGKGSSGAAREAMNLGRSEQEVAAMMLRHAGLLCQFKGQYIGMREMRKHAAWYTQGLSGSAAFRRRVNETETYDQFEQLVNEFFGKYA